MSKAQSTARTRKPPRFIQALFNPVAKSILRSPLHRVMSQQLLLMTFTGRRSGKTFTTPMSYVQEGETLWLKIGYSWWKNLRDEAPVRVLLRGKTRLGTAEVRGSEGDLVVVKVHLKAEVAGVVPE
jgi:hypothetical protein